MQHITHVYVTMNCSKIAYKYIFHLYVKVPGNSNFLYEPFGFIIFDVQSSPGIKYRFTYMTCIFAASK